jgi:hypothetical protein
MLQLMPGRNELVLSVQGRGAINEMVTVPTRLEFEVQ